MPIFCNSFKINIIQNNNFKNRNDHLPITKITSITTKFGP